MTRDLFFSLALYGRHSIKEGEGAVTFGCRRQVYARLGQVKAPLWHTHVVKGLGTGGHHTHGVGIGHAHVLPGEDQHTAEDEPWIFTGV